MLNRIKRPAVWTNFFYALPLAGSVYNGLWLTAASIAGLLVFSFAFHFSREKKFIAADILAAGVVAMFCLALVFGGGFQSGYVLLAALLILAGLYIRYWLERGNRGGLVHGLWHLVAAILILSCIFSYAG